MLFNWFTAVNIPRYMLPSGGQNVPKGIAFTTVYVTGTGLLPSVSVVDCAVNKPGR